MNTNFSIFKDAFYEAVNECKNLAPFNNYVHTLGIDEEGEDKLKVSFSFKELTGIERTAGIIIDRTDDVDVVVRTLCYALSEHYPGFVVWSLKDAVDAAVDFYKGKEVPEEPERWWYASVKSEEGEEKIVEVSMSQIFFESKICVASDADEYVEWFALDGDIVGTVKLDLFGEC